MASATSTPTKEPKMIRAVQPDMPDFSKMSASERLAWIKDFEKKTIADAETEFEEAINYTLKTAKSLGRTPFDVMEANFRVMGVQEQKEFTRKFAELRGLREPAVKRAGKTASPSKKNTPYEKGVTYKYQADSWVGGSRGRRPPWLRDLVPDSLSFEDAKAKYKELAVQH